MEKKGNDKPTNPMVTPLLNDLYQFTMAYAYWKAGKQSERSVSVSLSLTISNLNPLNQKVWDFIIFFRFDLYFRKNPFGGEYTIFAGLEECIKFLANFTLTDAEIDFVRDSLPGCEVTKTHNFFWCFYYIGFVLNWGGFESRKLSVITFVGLTVPTLKCTLFPKVLLCSLKCLYSGSKALLLWVLSWLID